MKTIGQKNVSILHAKRELMTHQVTKKRIYFYTLWLKFIIVSQLETYQSYTGIKLIIFFNKKVLKKEN